MDHPKVKKGQWIKIGKGAGLISRIDGYVIDIYPDGTLDVGYYQNDLKAIKQEVTWDGRCWKFSDGIGGSYLHDRDAAIVKAGPHLS